MKFMFLLKVYVVIVIYKNYLYINVDKIASSIQSQAYVTLPAKKLDFKSLARKTSNNFDSNFI